MFKKTTKILTKFILDILFPIECLGCGKDDVWLCEECLNKIPLTGDFIYPVRKNVFDEVGCLKIRHNQRSNTINGRHLSNGVYLTGNNFLNGVWAGSYYQKNELLQELIKNFKYKFVTDLSKPLSQIIIRSLIDNQLADQMIHGAKPLIIPVPLHRRRYLERGFNQAELLVQAISQYFNWPILTSVLKRQRYTTPQVSLTGQRRRDNLRGAFICLAPEVIQSKKIILIDDIFTTGSTLTECAKVLKQAGAREVWGLVVASDRT